MRENSKLKNQVVIVTGAALGIGRAMAIRFAQEGAKVACADIDLEGAKKVVKEIERSGGNAIALKVDVRDPKQAA